jgi:hypothetical protein
VPQLSGNGRTQLRKPKLRKTNENNKANNTPRITKRETRYAVTLNRIDGINQGIDTNQ